MMVATELLPNIEGADTRTFRSRNLLIVANPNEQPKAFDVKSGKEVVLSYTEADLFPQERLFWQSRPEQPL